MMNTLDEDLCGEGAELMLALLMLCSGPDPSIVFPGLLSAVRMTGRQLPQAESRAVAARLLREVADELEASDATRH